MELLELHLQAFGPFTDCRLDLRQGSLGLHLIHGPNEAGKSSALRALHALLFGIPARTRDDFVHGARDLRIGARLRAADGTELVCYRRKGNKETLLTAEQQPLAEAALRAMLGGVDAENFRRLFGIDHQTLVSGGEELLAERGAAADALFGAGIGSLNLRDIASTLSAEADALFRPQASKPLLNQELARYRELERALKGAGLGARDWEAAERDLTAAEQELDGLKQQILSAETRRGLLERVRRTQPNLARLDELDAQLAVLGERPTLPEDFSRRRAQAERALHEATSQALVAQASLARLKHQIDQLVVCDALLAEADSIEQLSEELGGYRKAARDRPGLVAERDALHQQAARLLAVARPALPVARVESLRPLLALQRGTQQLAAEGTRLKAACEHLVKAERDLAGQLAEREARLAESPAPVPLVALVALEDAVGAARRAGDLDRQIADASEELANAEQQAARILAAADLWPGDLAALCRAALPSESELQAFLDREQELARAAEHLAAEMAENQREQARAHERLCALELTGEIPSEEQLAAARARREALWQRIRARCLGVAAAPAALEAGQGEDPRHLSLLFETSQGEADGIADRLRREAASVHELAGVRARLEQTQATAAALASTGQEQRAAATLLDEQWQALWAPLGIKPRPPAAMRDWQQRIRPLIDQAGQRDSLARRLTRLAQERGALIDSLRCAQAVAAPAATSDQTAALLAPAVRDAERALSRVQTQAREHQALHQACQELRARRDQLAAEAATASAALTDWQQRWHARLVELGLPSGRDAEAVAEDFERLAALFARLDQAAALEARIQAIDADASAFGERARALLERLASPIDANSLGSRAKPTQEPALEPALVALRERLVREREARSRGDALRLQCQQAEVELARIQAEQTAARTTLAELCRVAGAAEPGELPEIETRVRARQACRDEREQIAAELRRAGDGLSLTELGAEAAAFAPDALGAELGAIEQRLSLELRPQEHAAIERKLAARQRLMAMDGSARAASLAEQLAQSRARLDRLARQWLRARFAARLLEDAKDRFAERHRDPLLPLIAGYFSQLTEGAFSGVEIDQDHAEQPLLIARRRGGARLGVEALSTGTRDQLYLALRLATLERRAAATEPLPLVVDDILVQFDDRRSRATLAALAAFATHTQVLLFTHHRYVMEQARLLQVEAENAPVSGKATPSVVIRLHELCPG
jgi:uncharacterized protein YhaN